MQHDAINISSNIHVCFLGNRISSLIGSVALVDDSKELTERRAADGLLRKVRKGRHFSVNKTDGPLVSVSNAC